MSYKNPVLLLSSKRQALHVCCCQIATVGAYKVNIITFADTKFITKVILLSVKLALQPRTTLDTIHTRDSTIASLPQSSCAHSAAATVVQHRSLTARGALARVTVTGIRAIYCVFRTPGSSSRHGQQEEGEEQEALHVLQG